MYGKFAMIPVMEPSHQQEAYDMVRYAFDLSEEMRLPVLLRIPTRLSHSRSVIRRSETRRQNPLNPVVDSNAWVLLPAIARKNYQRLIDKQPQLIALSDASNFNMAVSYTHLNSTRKSSTKY